MNFIYRIFDYFNVHRKVMYLVLALSALISLVLVAHVNYKEDITDFLPFDSRDKEAMSVYQSISGANRIIAIVGGKDTADVSPDEIAASVDKLSGLMSKAGITGVTAHVDLDKAAAVSEFVYGNIPYFLTGSDYRRMERQLADTGFVSRQLAHDKQMLLLPSGGMLSGNIARDPLGLFTPVLMKLSPQTSKAGYELYDGCIFMPDMKHAIVMADSPYGSSETEHNRELVGKIRSIAKQVEDGTPCIRIHVTGGPVIAVGNARQIKTDSAVSVVIAVVLILILLFMTLRSAWNIILIALSIAWGWLFALGGLSLVHNDISVIVIGISSVILGIAINYPLHFIAHLSHTPDTRRALKEILMPLLVGNITTIGAFLTLVPLRSVALRDLGLFAALLLMGTIVFVFIFLPHLVKHVQPHEHRLLDRIGRMRIDGKPWLLVAVALLTVVLAYFSTKTSFDTNFSHINYMTGEEKQDMEYLASQQNADAGMKDIYVVSAAGSLDGALAANDSIQGRLSHISKSGIGGNVSGCAQFFCSRKEQERRLQNWQSFVNRHAAALHASLVKEAKKNGFTEGSFDGFCHLLSKDYPLRSADYFKVLRESVFHDNILYDEKEKTYSIVTTLSVPRKNVDAAMTWLNGNIDDACHYHFEISQLNSVVANSLSDNFNYIGYACGFIVFFFLWLSMGNIELASLSFLPMAVSWIWILGIMGLTHTDFNIVNIILATFIFGQGDDYTIFMTEGCQYEYAYGRKMLASYKNSILISALIMFIGMGALITARHPALHSLAVVTIIGMFSVVLMAWLLPPFVFRWLVAGKGGLRKRPLTLKSIAMPKRYPQECGKGLSMSQYKAYVRDVYYYCGAEITGKVRKSLNHYQDFVSVQDDVITVGKGTYGSVALLMALAHTGKSVVAECGGNDEEAVCRRMACRVAPEIKIERI